MICICLFALRATQLIYKANGRQRKWKQTNLNWSAMESNKNNVKNIKGFISRHSRKLQDMPSRGSHNNKTVNNNTKRTRLNSRFFHEWFTKLLPNTKRVSESSSLAHKFTHCSRIKNALHSRISHDLRNNWRLSVTRKAKRTQNLIKAQAYYPSWFMTVDRSRILF